MKTYYENILADVQTGINILENHCKAIEEQMQRIDANKQHWTDLFEEKFDKQTKLATLYERKREIIKKLHQLSN